MNIVFLTGTYVPKPHATGACIRSLAQALKSEHEVTVICPDKDSVKNYSASEGYDICSVSTAYNRFRNLLESRIDAESPCLKRAVLVQCLFMVRLWNYVRIVFRKTYRNRRLTKEYLHTLESLSTKPDMIIASCAPFEGVYAAMKYKLLNPITRFVPYLFDQYADAVGIYKDSIQKKLKYRWLLKEESGMFAVADLIMHVTWDAHIQDSFPAAGGKCIKVEHPFPYVEPGLLLNRRREDRADLSIADMTMVYAGTLTAYTSPVDILAMYARSDTDLPRLCFYSAGSQAASVGRYSTKDPRVSWRPWIEQDELSRVLFQADVCLSIAERRGLQISSKIFLYIRLGRPILHIFYSKQDANLPYLRRYPLALCMHVDSLRQESAPEAIAKWVAKIRRMSISQEEIDVLYQGLLPTSIMKVAFEGSCTGVERKHD